MMPRISFNLSQPDRDAESAIIRAWLERQPRGTDLSRQLRHLIVTGLDMRAVLQRIEARLDALETLAAEGAPLVASTSAPDAATATALATLLDFDHLDDNVSSA
jgi:hypothetical protein